MIGIVVGEPRAGLEAQSPDLVFVQGSKLAVDSVLAHFRVCTDDGLNGRILTRPGAQDFVFRHALAVNLVAPSRAVKD